MGHAAGLDRAALRRSEDAFVDDLLAPAPAHGCTVICARYARAYIDVNREAWELDQAMFADALPAHARRRTARVAAGLGSIARVVAEGQEIYDRKLSFARGVEAGGDACTRPITPRWPGCWRRSAPRTASRCWSTGTRCRPRRWRPTRG